MTLWLPVRAASRRPARLARAGLLLAAFVLAGALPGHARAADGPAEGAAARTAAIDRMLSALKLAPSEAAAGLLEQEIERAWLASGSPAVTLLLARGMRDLAAGAGQEALDDFDAALDLDPDLAEAWNRRALARLHLGDTDGAIRDLGEALRREPRHFAALQLLSRVAESQGNWKGAYEAWKKVIELDPRTPGGRERLDDLRRHAEGEGI